jgi:hypothetical protein
MGASVAIDGEVAVVGSPNRELININSGSALFFNIGFLGFHFEADHRVKEGELLDITVTRAPSVMTQLLSLRTLDRNAEDNLQHYVNELYSMSPYDKSAVDTLIGSTALGNEQRSLFVNGQYDYSGISDYEMLRYEGQFKPQEQLLSVSLKTNNDAILEKPHENATVQINLQGMFASQLGKLHTSFDIVDEDDGKSRANKAYFQHLDNGIKDFFQMGAAIDYYKRSNIVIVSSDQAPGVDANGNPLMNVGSAHILIKLSQGWQFVQTLSPPMEDITPMMKFGHSVAIDTPY